MAAQAIQWGWYRALRSISERGADWGKRTRRLTRKPVFSTILGYPFNRSQGRNGGHGSPGEGCCGCLKSWSPANRCATGASSPPDSSASTPAGAWAPAEPRVFFSGRPRRARRRATPVTWIPQMGRYQTQGGNAALRSPQWFRRPPARRRDSGAWLPSPIHPSNPGSTRCCPVASAATRPRRSAAATSAARVRRSCSSPVRSSRFSASSFRSRSAAWWR